MSASLAGQKVMVTGGTSGIGQAIVVAAARAGADIAFCGLTAEGAEVSRAAVEESGGHVYFEALDLTDLDAARRFARSAIAALGGLNAVVNNAGADFYRGVNRSTRRDIEDAMALNFYPAWALSQEAYPALRDAGGGVVINIASTHAERTIPGTFPYNMSKAALIALTKSQAVEWGRDNIRAIAVAPALVYVPPIESYLQSLPDRSAVTDLWESRYPLGRGGQPEEVAALVVSLLGAAGTFMSGTTISMDGGLSALKETPDAYLSQFGMGAGSRGRMSFSRVTRALARRAAARLPPGRR